MVLVGVDAQILLQGGHFQADAEDSHGHLQLLDGGQGGGDADHGVVGVDAVGVLAASVFLFERARRRV